MVSPIEQLVGVLTVLVLTYTIACELLRQRRNRREFRSTVAQLARRLEIPLATGVHRREVPTGRHRLRRS